MRYKRNHNPIKLRKLLFLTIALSLGRATPDPDPLQDYCIADNQKSPQPFVTNEKPCIDPAQANPTHFAMSLSDPAKTFSSKDYGFNISFANTDNMPGLNTLGLSMGRVVLAGHGLVAPHSHPRATEVITCLGGSLLVGFVDTTNRLYSQTLRPGESFVFPKGLVHFVYNEDTVGSAEALFGFNSQNPGILVASLATFATSPPIPNKVMTKAFWISDSDLAKIRKNLGG